MANRISTDVERNFRSLVDSGGFSSGGLWVPSGSLSVPMRIGDHDFNYPSPVMAQTGSGLVKTAGSGIIYTQPQFFSPIHTPINWQIPSKRKEIYQWCRFYYENEPKVASTLDFYSKFPINKFKNICNNRYVKRYYDKLVDKLKILKWLRIVSQEAHLLGDCFPFLEIDCELCGGSGVYGGQVCDHSGGSFKRMVILNPEYVEVYSNSLTPDPMIAFIPSEELRNTVLKRGPGHERLSEEVRKRISAGRPIPLDNRNVTHIKYNDNGYNRYGTGLVRRLFPMLAYKTKLLTAQWIIAERLILPIKIAKVGSDERPASAGDLAQVQAQLAQTANDPNLTLVTHHNFELDWFGACHDFETEVLTKDGWKKFPDVIVGESVMGYDSKTGEMSYQTPEAKQEYDYNGTMITISGKHMDVCVTPNHMMLAKTKMWVGGTSHYNYSEWHKIRADQVVRDTKFKVTAEWVGSIPQDLPYKKIQKLSHLSISDYLTFLGYFLSEGGYKVDDGVINAFHISQSEGSDCFEDIRRVMNLLSSKVQEGRDERREVPNIQFIINDSAFARELVASTGLKAHNKRIPRWVLDLPKSELAVLLNALMAGDGNVRFSADALPRFKYSSVSKGLADDVLELTFKLGYNAKIGVEKSGNPNHKDIYRICWACNCMEASGGERTVKERNIERVDYSGKVYCFTMPTGFLITRRNGKIGIHGNSGHVLQLTNEFELINQEILDGLGMNKALLNGEGPTYSNAAIGVEVMIDKLESWRQELAEFVEQKIYLPIAIMNGFVQKNEWGEMEYVYPKVKWDIMHLRDQQQYRTFLLGMHEKGTISTQRLLENFDIDYNEEVELLRYERAKGPDKGMGGGFGGGGAGMPGGMPGGMPDLGLGGGGGGAEMPMLTPEGGGGGGAPMGGAPAGPAAGGAPLAADAVPDIVPNIGEYGGRVLKKRTREKIRKYKEKLFKGPSGGTGVTRDEKGRVMFTGPERELLKVLADSVRKGEIRYNIYAQYPVKAGGEEYTIDFSMVPIKLGIEVDGSLFHSTDEQQASDRKRDDALARLGWTILRFTDKQIETRMRDVMDTIVKQMASKENWLKRRETPQAQ